MQKCCRSKGRGKIYFQHREKLPTIHLAKLSFNSEGESKLPTNIKKKVEGDDLENFKHYRTCPTRIFKEYSLSGNKNCYTTTQNHNN